MKKNILIICFSIVLSSCYSSSSDHSQIWNMDIQLFESKLLSLDYKFLHSFDFERLERKGELNEIYKLQKGSAFYFSFILGQLGLFEEQLRFLELEMIEGRWKKEAAETIITILSERELWSLLSSYLERYIKDIDNDPDILLRLLEALYNNKEYNKVVSYSNSDFTSHFSVLSLIEIEDSRWKDIIREHVYNKATSEEIYDIYSILMNKDLFYHLDESLRLLILVFVSYSENDFKQTGLYLQELNLDNDIISTYPSLIYKMRLPIEKSGQAGLWAVNFQSKNRSTSKRSLFAASFNSARLYLYEKDFENADLMFRQSIQNASSDFEEDRARWYLMNLYKNNIYFLTGLIEEFAPQWNDPFYFEDILMEYLSLVSSKGEWALFNKVFPLISLCGDKETIAAFSWVKYLAYKSKYLGENNPSTLINNMLNSRHMGYYNLIGHLISGNQSQLVLNEFNDLEHSDFDDYILGFLYFSLFDEALSQSSGKEALLSDDVLRTASHKAALNGNFLRSIQLINYVSSKEGYKYTQEDLELMYPNVYDNSINFYSKEYGFSDDILSGIIRTESAFTSDIISYAGAVGLSQLMPETAREQAGKLNLINPDLTDPETNIHIGSSYIKWITDRPWTDNMSQMLIAYNAGGGNLRKWKRIYPDYRDELFTEVIPYKETRNYVKKVLTSSILYGYLYKGLNPEDSVRDIYPDFNSLKSINY